MLLIRLVGLGFELCLGYPYGFVGMLSYCHIWWSLLYPSLNFPVIGINSTQFLSIIMKNFMHTPFFLAADFSYVQLFLVSSQVFAPLIGRVIHSFRFS